MRASHRFGLAAAVLALGLVLPAAAQAPAQYWCEPLHAYYPRVASCPAPWRTIGPAGPASPPAAPAYVPYPTQYAPYDNYNHGNGP